MTTPLDTLAMRARHEHRNVNDGGRGWCNEAAYPEWPCDAIQLLDELAASRADLAASRALLAEAGHAVEDMLRDMHTGEAGVKHRSLGHDGLGCRRRCETCDRARGALTRIRAAAGTQASEPAQTEMHHEGRLTAERTTATQPAPSPAPTADGTREMASRTGSPAPERAKAGGYVHRFDPGLDGMCRYRDPQGRSGEGRCGCPAEMHAASEPAPAVRLIQHPFVAPDPDRCDHPDAEGFAPCGHRAAAHTPEPR